jgi:probable HAF family extracellular repeat protein
LSITVVEGIESASSFENRHAINNLGQVVGSMRDESGITGAAIWQDGVALRNLGTTGLPPGSFATTARGINDSSQVVGELRLVLGVDPGTGLEQVEQRGYVWEDGQFTVLPEFADLPFFTFGETQDINESGQVVGGAITGIGRTRAFSWEPGEPQLTDIGAHGPTDNSRAVAVNDHGTIVGHSNLFVPDSPVGFILAALWDNKDAAARNLGALGDGNLSYTNDINNSGQVVGRSNEQPNMGAFQPVTWAPGAETPTALEMLPGWTGGRALSINENGDIVGHVTLASFENRAVLWERGGAAQDLNELVNPAGGWRLTEAMGVNEHNQILVRAFQGSDTIPTVLLLDQPALDIAIAIEPTNVPVGESFFVTVTVTNNTSETLTNVMPSADLTIAGDGAATLTTGPTPTFFDTLGPDESGEFAYEYLATETGSLVIGAQIEGTGADGLVVNEIPATCTSSSLSSCTAPNALEILAADGGPSAVLDVTGSGNANPFQDGVIIVRHMLGQPAANLEDPALIPSDATRTTGAELSTHLDAVGDALDVNGDGVVNPFQDGILIVRYLLGQPVANLDDPALIPAGSTRTTGAAIGAYLETLIPSSGEGEFVLTDDALLAVPRIQNDVNSDGSVTVPDALQVVSASKPDRVVNDLLPLNTNEYGRVTGADALRVINRVPKPVFTGENAQENKSSEAVDELLSDGSFINILSQALLRL